MQQVHQATFNSEKIGFCLKTPLKVCMSGVCKSEEYFIKIYKWIHNLKQIKITSLCLQWFISYHRDIENVTYVSMYVVQKINQK
jgi:hypothetical protein